MIMVWLCRSGVSCRNIEPRGNTCRLICCQLEERAVAEVRDTRSAPQEL